MNDDRRWPVLLALLLPALVVTVAAACGGGNGSAQAADTQLDAVRRGNLLITVSATGNVSFPKQARVTFPASGTVTEVPVSWGQEVQEGQVLARMDASALSASLLDAELNVLRAQKAMSDALDQFSEEQVAKARSSVASSKAAVLQAEKALDAYRDQFSEEQVTKARNAVASANTSVLQAQKALDAYHETFTPLGLLKGESAVVSTQVGVSQAEKALRDYRDSFSPDKLNKLRATVESAKLTLLNAEAALANAPQEGPGKPVYDAKNRVAAAEQGIRDAQVALDAARNDLSVATLDWDMRQGQQERQVAVAETTYENQMNARYRISLNTAALRLHPPEYFLGTDVTVPTTIQDAWNALADLRTSYSVLLLQRTKALAAAQNNVARAEDVLKAAVRARDEAVLAHQNALAAETSRLRASELAVEHAKLAVTDAEGAMNEALAGPDNVQVSTLLVSVDGAKIKLQDAQKALDEAKRGPDPRELEILQGAIDSARARVQEAEGALSDVKRGPDPKELQVLQVTIDSARQRVVEAESALNKLLLGIDPAEKASLENAIASAELRLKQAGDNLERTVLKAPFSGVVSAVGVTAGEVAGANAAAVTLVDTRTVEVTTSVDEIDLPKLKLGQIVALTSDSTPGLRVAGTVKAIAPVATVQQGVVSYSVLLNVQGPGVPSLRGGMTLSAEIVIENKQGVLLVPLRAVQASGQNRVVNVMENGIATPKTIRVGSSNAQFVEILDGLVEGAQIVVPARTSNTQQTQFRFPGGGFPGGGGIVPVGGGGGARPGGR